MNRYIYIYIYVYIGRGDFPGSSVQTLLCQAPKEGFILAFALPPPRLKGVFVGLGSFPLSLSNAPLPQFAFQPSSLSSISTSAPIILNFILNFCPDLYIHSLFPALVSASIPNSIFTRNVIERLDG